MNRKKEPNLIPMINIIFLLMIFFMLSGVISKKDKIVIERPVSQNSKEIKNNDKFLTFTVLKNGDIFFENKQISLDNLQNLIYDNYKNFREKEIFLDIDKKTYVKNLNEILQILKTGKVEKVFINTEAQK